ncbi:4-(cytidine 5'-diphospho)-2-C-methyl-D-erythritol kinase [Fannyhessea vaginae]|uniref:4-diphosphocytidyl-2-C-methyl-D-erythritol kinase n=1 Tax=Fannyhessea vaginae DSM 15829 TaxID=525256 RepID=F1T6S3_9ACTN|nr:4-(cytidine 5'-diphospho)-2-C-methyl-D-erythritol kinase [Fannyhessea vaginae]EGF22798.1 putative 4-(cytidine 5'-diphospho)-2-C-methyl-D-erythritol kinase [Fannyhessea vaginae DSM 15829]QPR41413.1 4-diphosphocytidyl-2C-methyl-D-erythritol kinase [Fannyhessea vaginae]SSZ03242.1 4-diphosphocytidyl-2-C-methyl-D-erythritol kinase [Fannyhessea vaginae]
MNNSVTCCASYQDAAPAYAKINLHLGIYPHNVGESGYHRADSVMAALELADTVTLSYNERAQQNTVVMDAGPDVAMKDNTAFRALEAMCQTFHKQPAYTVTIQKHIPAQAGLGGSSSDAATTIKLLCKFWGIDALDARVVRVAQSIGADVAFFLHPIPAYLNGVGATLQESFEHVPSIPCVIVRPQAGVSTPVAYRLFDEHVQTGVETELKPRSELGAELKQRLNPEAGIQSFMPQSPDRIIQALRVGDVLALNGLLYNNLAEAVIQQVADIREVLAWLRTQQGISHPCVTGSGSAVFAFAQSSAICDEIALKASKMRNWWVYSTKTLGLNHVF